MSVRGMIFVLMLGFTAGCHSQSPTLTKLQKGQIQDLVQTEIENGSFPGAVVLIGQDQTVLFKEAFGDQAIEPNRQPMHMDTVFDLASMTKPLATAASVMVLMDQAKIDPNDTVATYLPDFASEGKDTVQIRHLLTHTSGLPAYTGAEALEEAHGSPCPDAVIKTICQYEALNEPGEIFRYSCLGYILLSRIVTEISGQSLDEFSQAHLFEPMGMQHTTFNPPDAWHDHVAATKIV
ncbi:MAG: beta-lactamase family protein, partial [Phycisphaeraceae bacterium]|nr:beta-lactamase family protein [Phycisphaeraceae bacterium]